MATDRRWWRQAVLYQIYPRSFSDSDGDGVGDLRGITARIDHLAQLGVHALWLSPIYPSPMADFGYDVADYTAVDERFGTLADLDRLVEAAHARGLRVILDFVPNHTSDRHPWFVASRSSRADPHRDWYVWRDPAPGGGPPNNWVRRFGGGPAWTFDEATGQYYLHSFLPAQPDLNWRAPALRAAMQDVLRFWMRRGIDGFRVDVAHRIVKDAALRDNPANPAYRRGMPDYARVVERYSRNWPEVHEVHRLLRRTVDEFDDPPRLLMGEVNLHPPELVAYYGDDDEFHLPLNFHTVVDMPWTATALADLVDEMEQVLPADAWPTWILSNHDKSRFPTRLGREYARQAIVFLLTARGTPVLYYGDELAMGDADVPPERMQDPWGRQVPEESRDPQRAPMPWNGGPGGGFCPPDVRPWLPLAADADTRNVSVQLADPTSELHLVRALTATRAARPSLRVGAVRTLAVTDGCYVYERSTGGERTVVALSFWGEPLTLPVATGDAYEILCSSTMRRVGTVGGDLALAPYEAVVLAP